MELFIREAVLRGPLGEVRTWAADIAKAFTEATDKPIAVWTSIAGGQAGHYVWGRQVEGLAEVVADGMTASADQTYLELAAQAQPWLSGGVTDTLMSPVTEPLPQPSSVGNVAVVTRAAARAGHLFPAIEWGVKALELARNASGADATLLRSQAGPYSDLTWLAIFPDAGSADEANQKMMSDTGYVNHLAHGTEVFISGSGNQQVFLRIA